MTKITNTNNKRYALIFSTVPAVYRVVSGLPSRIYTTYSGRVAYLYPITELADVIDALKMLNIEYTIDQEVNNLYKLHLEKIELLQKIRKMEQVDIKYPKHFKAKLFKYQTGLVAQALMMKKYLYAIEVGMGKTVISLFLLLRILEDGVENFGINDFEKTNRALIVCEANQIHKTWIKTIINMSDFKDFTFIQGNSDERKRQIRKALSNNTKLWIVNYETLRINFNDIPHKWDIVIADEVTKIKNVSAKSSKVLQAIESPFRIGLSATPITSSYFDLYGVMKFVNPDIFTTKKNFTNIYLKLDFFGRPAGVKNGMEEKLQKKIDPWMVQMVKADIGGEKPIDIRTISVALAPRQKVLFDEIERKIENDETTLFEQGMNIRMLCNTIKIIPGYEDVDFYDSTNKFKVLENLLEKIVKKEYKKVVVFTYFKRVAELIKEKYGDKYKMRVVTGETKKTCKNASEMNCFQCKFYKDCKSIKKYIFEFVEGDVEVLLGTDSLSRSHDLYTCDTMINFDLPWNSSDLKQRIGRIDRKINNAPKFFMYNIVTQGTIEERIIKTIERKEKETSKVLPKYHVKLSKLSNTIKVITK